MKQSELIARLILSTKRKKREFSIVEIAADISSLKGILGGLNEVSKVIGISTGMLNQFLSVHKLPGEIQLLVKERKIDSVAIVFLLSKFPKEDVLDLSKKILDDRISSQELKILLPYRKQHPAQNILQLIENLDASKNIKVSVIKLPKNITSRSNDYVSNIISAKVGKDNFVIVTEDEEFLNIKIKREGEKILREIAKNKKLTLSELIITLIK